MRQRNIINIEEILSYLKLKKNHYEEILKQTQNLEEAIKANNIKALDLVITEKANCVKDLKRLDRLNTKYQEEIMSNHENLISDKRFNILKEQLLAIITKITNYDQKCIILLKSSIDNTKDRIDSINKKRTVRRTIRTKEMLQPSFVDVLS